ncbi:MAG TPA: hypothetical protein VN908_07105 [Gemmatimonadales bacterium]|nr:hypothetical protein [Gemmatimonadales bacterium]
MRTLAAIVVLLMCTAFRPIAAQWHIGLELATTHYGGSARDTSGGHVASHGRPGDATMVGTRFGRDGRRYGIALRASYATTGLTVAGRGVSVTDRTTGRLLELVAAFRIRVGGIGPSGAVRAELGPALHLWDFDGEIRSGLGAVGAAAYEWPVAGRFSSAIRLEGMLSPSWFAAADLPPEYERRVTWRYGVGLGLHYRL